MKKFNEEEIKYEVIKKLKTIQDSELPVNIYDLGFVYKIDLKENDDKLIANIEMTILNSRCASTKSYTDLIKSKVESIDEVNECNVKFVFTPKWDVKMISEDGLKKLRDANI